MGRQLVEAERVPLDERAVVQALAHDHVHHRQGQRRVRSRAEHEDLVGLGGRLGLAHVHGDDVGAAPAGRGHVARGVRLAGQVGAPEDDEIGVGTHVFLGARLQ